MAKIKLNLPTGVSVEKTLLNCFKTDNNTYIVFDADSVGSMGLPIILVCKLENNRVIKIESAEEWNKVKGYLKEIISGIDKEYIKLDLNLEADEIFYTQLTLPLASFDVLKSAYKVTENEVAANASQADAISNLSNDNVNVENIQITNIPEASNEVVIPNVTTVAANQIALDDNLSMQPLENDVASDLNLAQKEVPVGNDAAVANPLLSDIMPSLESQENPVSSAIPAKDINVDLENEQPIISEINEESAFSAPIIVNDSNSAIDYTADKEAFLKACGNMFDALVSKFQAKINNSDNN